MNSLVEWACFECGMQKQVKFHLCRSSSSYYLSWYDDTTLPEKRVFYDLYNGLYGYIYRNVIVSASYLNNKEIYKIDLSKVINDDKYWLYTENFLIISFDNEVDCDKITIAGTL